MADHIGRWQFAVALVLAAGGSQLYAACAVVDGDFITADGGCRDMATGLVWSSNVMTPIGAFGLWFSDADSVCDQFGNGKDTDGNGEPDVFFPEAQGFADWRAPTVREVLTALDNGLATHLDYEYDAGAQTADGRYNFTQCTNRIKGFGFIHAGYAIRHTDGDMIHVQEIEGGPDSLVCVRGAPANLDQDCPNSKGQLPSEDGGGGKGNGKGKNSMLMPRSVTGTLLVLPALAGVGLGLAGRRRE